MSQAKYAGRVLVIHVCRKKPKDRSEGDYPIRLQKRGEEAIKMHLPASAIYRLMQQADTVNFISTGNKHYVYLD